MMEVALLSQLSVRMDGFTRPMQELPTAPPLCDQERTSTDPMVIKIRIGRLFGQALVHLSHHVALRTAKAHGLGGSHDRKAAKNDKDRTG